MAIQERAVGIDKRWGEYAAEEWADAAVTSMKLGGIDNLFFVSGTELAFYQEATAKAKDLGRPSPRLITMMHEQTALNAALGAAMVTGQPSATAVHVDVGTLNYGGAIHTAWRGAYPVMMTAGTGPRAYPGTRPGARDNTIQWYQEARDQGEILRQYTKMDHRMEGQDNPGLMISRMLQVSMSEPQGPVYLVFPREAAMTQIPGGRVRFPTRDQLGLARSAWPAPDDAKEIARWLIQADNPCIYPANNGRHPESVEELVRLAELLAAPVMPNRGARGVAFPSTHPLCGTGPAPKDADALLIVENPVPWIMPDEAPSPDARIAWVDIDPVQSRFKTMEWEADLWLPVSTASAARAIYEAAAGMLTQSDMNRIAERRERLERRKQEQNAAADAAADKARQRHPLHPRVVGYELGKILEPDSILVDDALSNGVYVSTYARRDKPGSHFKSGGSSGGWGTGAAFGAALASPGRDVVLAAGDGFFMFDNPVAAIWAASYHKAPYLSVVFVNRSYSTGTNTVRNSYPEGTVAEKGLYEGGVFDPPPDYAKIAEAGNGYGETVREPEEVGPALRRGLDAVHHGSPAVIAFWLPTLVEEMSLAK